MSIEQVPSFEKIAIRSPAVCRPPIKTHSSQNRSKSKPKSELKSPKEIRSTAIHTLPSISSSSLSTLTSLSELAKENVKDVKALHPCTNLNFLRSVHKRAKRRRKLRKFRRIFHYIFVYGLPIGGAVFGVAGILVGHFLLIKPIFVGGCLILIIAVGLIIQACFWRRSLPNKFHAKDIPFNMPQEDSLSSKSNEHSNQVMNKNASTAAESVRSPTINQAQARRLSLALNRATAELSAVRQISSVTNNGNCVLNLARRLTVASMQFGDYGGMREFDSGHGWIAGRFQHGVRRGLAWNDTGASRFYASNYD